MMKLIDHHTPKPSRDFKSAIAYLFNLQKFGIKLGLANITDLLKYLGNPQKKLRCIHVAGTNGKGSTCAFLVSILKKSGCRTGLYISPHLIDFTERIRINDTQIPGERVIQLTADIKRICEQHALHHITFFEFVTAMAFKYFEEEKADPVIVEVGMGGRYDATNVIKPLVSIITSISLEHQKYLGKTLSLIAGEKAGIIKKNAPVISGAHQARVHAIISQNCKIQGSPLYRLGADITYRKTGQGTFNYKGTTLQLSSLHAGLRGDHQIKNASLAVAAAELLRNSNYCISSQNIVDGISEAFWPGRIEVVREQPTVILDGAHNPEGWRVLKATLKKDFSYKRLILLLGIMEDKNIQQMLKILTPGAYAIIFCRPEMERAANKDLLEKFIRFSFRNRVFWIDTSKEALEKALSMAMRTDDLLCITGSLFLVGEIRELMLNKKLSSPGRIGL
ncbi:MAG: folylpolyglutamate synthase/dihydrofolate synthase family protein [Pseudomonadota bacterium]